MPVISTPVDAVGPRPGSCTLTVCGPGRMSAIANLPSLPVTAVIFSLAAAVYTVTFAPATGSPAAVRTTPVHAGADGELCCASSERSEEHTSELQSQSNLVCRLLLEKKK